jgi:starch-binding outer membrane protein, SusD/RagB family
MKRNSYIPGILTLLVFLVSCENYLDRELSTDLTYDEVTKQFNYSRSRVASIYSDLQAGFLQIDGAMMASATDEAEHTLETSDIQKFNYGSWNASSNPDNVWSALFKGIRKSNQFLVSADSINLDLYKYDPLPAQQTVYLSRLAEIKRWKYEVRYLRAFFYFELIKRYGGVPLLTSALSLNQDYDDIKRSSLQDCIQFIVNECDSASAILPVKYGDTDLGRATKGAALALKSRVLLYAASDLFNTPAWASGYAQPELISLSGDRQAKWAAAAAAAKAVIDLPGTGYTLPAYNSVFSTTTHTNTEVIFCRRAGGTNTFERANYSVGYDFGQSGTTPSQNLVDAYEMRTTGMPITEDGSGYDSANPYANRDPRLGLSIIVNNSTWKSRAIECWNGGRDGKGVTNATKTGYYLKKYVNEGLNLITNTTSVHSWVFFRLAEMHLNYAEALNEASPGHADIKASIDKVRQRTGVAMPVLPAGLDQAQMRDRIRKERRVEFAFEDQRFWDVRRWMIAPEVLSTPLKGMQITRNEDGSFNYTVINVENRKFDSKMYFYPIPQNELFIAKGLVQNPLW